VDDLLSVIEQRTPVVSDAEIIMHDQLRRYRVQLNCLNDKVKLLAQFISSQSSDGNRQQQQQIDNSSMENVEKYVQHHRNQIDRMKKQLETITNNN
jgi:archaellum component FlaC